MKLKTFSAVVLGLSMLYHTGGQAMVKGADVSWLTQMEKSGYKFYNDSGTQQDLFPILKAHGMNAVRLRVWVTQALAGATSPMWSPKPNALKRQASIS